MNLTRGINMRKIAEVMPGASGAEVKVSERGTLVYIHSLSPPPLPLLGCVYRGWYVRPQREKSPRNPGGF